MLCAFMKRKKTSEENNKNIHERVKKWVGKYVDENFGNNENDITKREGEKRTHMQR